MNLFKKCLIPILYIYILKYKNYLFSNNSNIISVIIIIINFEDKCDQISLKDLFNLI